jgi:GT2 family glycosyltransferase
VRPEVSVIIPLHRPTPAFWRCVDSLVALDETLCELIVVSDRELDGLPERVRLIVTGSSSDSSPAEKRDAALAHVRGEICAFLDDDAYPATDWIQRAMKRFADPGIAAVGGPGLTPPGSNWRERASGAFYESPFGSGGLRFRFLALGEVRDVDDFPAYNFFVRTGVLREIGGWASRFYGGEDTRVCLALVEAGHRIVYDPAVVVYHHRREVFGGHMRQLANVGRHRGYFVRAFPGTSARPMYFAPSAAVLGAALIGIWAAGSPRRAAGVTGAGLLAGLAITGWAVRDGQGSAVAAALPAVVAASHTAYGLAFLRGLVTREIDSM